jgi:hypothetical protein
MLTIKDRLMEMTRTEDNIYKMFITSEEQPQNIYNITSFKLFFNLGFCFVFGCDWSLNSGLYVCKAGLYHLSHTSSPLCSGYFGHCV